MHRLATKGPAISRGTFPAPRQRTAVAFSLVEIMNDVAVEPPGSAIPGPHTDEYATREPFGPVIAIRSAVIGRDLVVSVGANRRNPETYRNARRAAAGETSKSDKSNRQNAQSFERLHNLSFPWCVSDCRKGLVRRRTISHASFAINTITMFAGQGNGSFCAVHKGDQSVRSRNQIADKRSGVRHRVRTVGTGRSTVTGWRRGGWHD